MDRCTQCGELRGQSTFCFAGGATSYHYFPDPPSENTQRCKECGEDVKFCGTLNNVGQCSECSVICEACGISINQEPIIDGICKNCR